MARQPMVTRTIITTKVNVMCLDVEHGEPCNRTITIPRTYKDEKALLIAFVFLIVLIKAIFINLIL